MRKDEFLKTEDVQKILGYKSVRTVERKCRSGQIKATKLDGQWRIRRSNLEKMIP